jgi:hypothetical protein
MAWWSPYWGSEAEMIAHTTPVFRARQGAASSGGAAPVGGLPSAPKAPMPTINKTSTTQEFKLRVSSASDALIPIAYGPCELGGNVFAIDVAGTDLIMGVWFCLGEIEEFTKIYLNDDDVPVTVTIQEHKGTTSQTTDSILANISGYADDLVLNVGGTDIGVAYIAARIPLVSVKGFPRFTAVIKGMKDIYDTRTASTAYSDNPALCFRNWLKSSVYGPGYSVLDSTVSTAANFCDETPGDTWQASHGYALEAFVVPTVENTYVYECTTSGTSGGSQPTWGTTIGGTTADGSVVWTCRDGRRRACGMVMDRKADIPAWIETWRTACGCMIIWGESGIEMIPDKARATDHTITHADGQILESPGLSLHKKGLENIPNVVKVFYTETSGHPWRDTWVRVADSDVDAGTVPARESEVRMPWVQRKSQAVREAIERFNAATLTNLSFDLPVFDEGLEIKAGDVVEVTHPIGLTSKKMRVLKASQSHPGRWLLSLYEYDSAVYSEYTCPDPVYVSFLFNTGIVLDFVEQITGSGKPEDNADVTSAHGQGVAWLNEAVGTSLPVANTDAKCTDPNADQTSANTSYNTSRVDDADTNTGKYHDVYGDFHLKAGADIGFYDIRGGFVGGLYGGSSTNHELIVSMTLKPYATDTYRLGKSGYRWLEGHFGDQGVRVGAGAEMQLWNDGTWNRLTVHNNNFIIVDNDYGYTILGLYRNDGVYQYFQGSQKCRTTSTGITVTGSCSGCDYVFEPDYDLMPLDVLKEYIKANKCLPFMSVNKGREVDFNDLRQESIEKIEEQTLYILQLHDRITVLERGYK